MRFVVREQFRRGAVSEFFELLWSTRARRTVVDLRMTRRTGFQRFSQAIRRFEINRCFLAGSCARQFALALPALDR